MRGQVIGQLIAVKQTVSGLISRQERGGSAAGETTSHNNLDRQRVGVDGDEGIGIWNIDHVIGHNVVGSGEPPGRQLVQNLALVGDSAKHPVECAYPVGGDEQATLTRQPPTFSDLSRTVIGEIKSDRKQVCRGAHLSIMLTGVSQ